MTVFTDILEWSAERPAWQRDALRRIVTQESLTEQDISELFCICLAQHGLSVPDDPALEPQPLSADNIPAPDASVESVQLVSLSEIQGVNALAPHQEMGFELDGLTIIFGYNGSGKSGYARILRVMCHARHSGDHILSNAFDGGDRTTPSALVEFQTGSVRQSETWEQGQNPPPQLSQISYFDSDCAAVHVDDTNELAFTPFGLDVLPKLVSACRQVGGSIDHLLGETERARPVSLVNPQAKEGTSVRAILAALNAESDIEKFRSLSQLSERERERIGELREALGTDPAARAHELRNMVTRLRRLHSGIESVATALSTDSVERIGAYLQDLVTKKAAARTAAGRAFDGQPLAGVGDEVWQELWDAARRFSQQLAYPDEEYPFTGEGARCVMCQQPLDADAIERVTAFEAFVRDETQRAADQAQVDLTQALSELERLAVGHAACTEFLPDLPNSDLELNRSIRRFHRIAWRIRRSILRSCSESQWSALMELPPAPDLSVLVDGLLRRAEELETSAGGEQRQALIAKKNELVAREWLSGILDDVEIEISRRHRLDALETAKRETITTGITRKSSELTDQYVTDVLRNRFTDEINAIDAKHLPVEIVPLGGQLGHKQFKISFRGESVNIAIRRVLSEGEFRCIALAGFLAELSTENSRSGLIFDDPVTSMDHLWRRKIARRLVDLAVDRQVIVFTHDIVFLSDLVGFSITRGVPLRQSYLRRGPVRPGECLDGVPWPAMKVRERIGRLKVILQTAEVSFRREGVEAYEPQGRRIYGLLRETWERAVEEVLLNGAVIRFDCAIHTQQLRHLADITADDLHKIDVGMTKASRFLEGHDDAQAVADSVPSPDELRQDISDIENWVAEVRRRRN